MTRVLRLLVFIGCGVTLVLLVVLWVLYTLAQREPDFYADALAANPQEQARDGDDFERQLLRLQNESRTEEDWQVEFTETQVNGWLAADLPVKFPSALPPRVSKPRVGIDVNQLNIAFQFDSRRIKGVVNAEVDVFCTDVPRQLAVQIKRVRSGIIPIPITAIADRITLALRKLGLSVEWTEVDSDPVALIDFPNDLLTLGDKHIQIQSVQLLEETLVLSGKSISIK